MVSDGKGVPRGEFGVTYIAVLGASGFVGSALCERMYFQGVRFTPFVHNTGNAARIARLGIPLQRLDLLQKEALPDLLSGHDVVINCALGDGTVMKRGFNNLLNAMQRLRTRKFIHLSSTAIYGEEPAAESASEEGAPDPQSNPYALAKLRQDEAVFRLNRKGVASYILCPVNVVGPYSLFTIGLVEALKLGNMPLVDGGANPSNLVHVDNLVEAILVASRSSKGEGERYFVNETRVVSWRDTLQDHARLIGIRPQFVNVTRHQVLPYLLGRQRKPTLKDHGRILISGEFRRALSMLPIVSHVDSIAAAAFASLPEGFQLRIRERLQWPLPVPHPADLSDFNSRFARVQIRKQYHSPAKLADHLGWAPPLDYVAGMENTAAWLNFVGLADG